MRPRSSRRLPTRVGRVMCDWGMRLSTPPCSRLDCWARKAVALTRRCPCGAARPVAALNTAKRASSAHARGSACGIVASAMRYQARYLPHALQETYGLRGAATTLSNACASGADLIGTAASLIASGRVERIAAGGAESLSSLLFHGFSCLRALSPTTCRPFSSLARWAVARGRSGFCGARK